MTNSGPCGKFEEAGEPVRAFSLTMGGHRRLIPSRRLGGIFRLSLLIWTAALEVTHGEGSPLAGRTVVPGLDWVYWTGGPACRSGDPGIGVLAADPNRLRFQVLHYTLQTESHPLTAWEWLEQVRPVALFNAGQYYPDYSYMGLLIHGGRSIKGRLHPLFQALFVAEPVDGMPPRAKILDLASETFHPQSPGYLEAAQSFMLLDRSGLLRVQRSLNVANRTVVAEGRDGRIWIFVTRGGYTLWELGELLRSGPFPIIHAMSMDGGEEAQLLVRAGGFLYDSLGPWDAQEGVGRPGPRDRVRLPTVIGIFPRD